jgi:hypothetical protein
MTTRNGQTVDGYNASDFGADEITADDNWKGSGYTHYTAHSSSGGQISWNVSPEGEAVNLHMSDANCEGDQPTTIWT